jgi:hypothetical protein
VGAGWDGERIIYRVEVDGGGFGRDGELRSDMDGFCGGHGLCIVYRFYRWRDYFGEEADCAGVEMVVGAMSEDCLENGGRVMSYDELR